MDMAIRRDTLRRIGRSLNRIPEADRIREVPAVEDLFGIEQAVKVAEKELKINIDADGKTYDTSGDQPREISVRDYEQRFIGNYTRKQTIPVIDSGEAEVRASDGGTAQIMKTVIVAQVPTLMERLVQELKCAPDLAQAAMADRGIRFEPEENKFYRIRAGGNIPLKLEEAVTAGKDYFVSLVTPTKTLPKAEEAVLPVVEEKVALPIQPSRADCLKNFVQEFKKSPEELEKVLRKGRYFISKDRIFCRYIGDASAGGTIPGIAVPETEVRNFLWNYYTAPAKDVVVAQETAAPIALEPAAPTDLETAVDEDVLIDEDVISDNVETENTLDVKLTPEEKELYIGPLVNTHGKPLDRIEAVLAEKELYAGKDGKFYHRLPERDGSLKGEEIPVADVNNMLGDYFAAERLPIITPETATAEKKDAVGIPVVPLPEKTHPVTPDHQDRTVGDWFDEGTEIPHQDTNGLEKAIAETAAVNPEDIVKRPWHSYAVIGIGVALAAGAIYTMGYLAGESGKIKTVTKTVTKIVVDNTLVDQLNGQLTSQKEELETAYGDNDDLNDMNYLATRENDNLVSELGMLSNQLDQKDIQYTALEQQLPSVPDAQEVNALREKNSALEMAREQASIKAQEAERKAGEWEVKYGACSSAKDVCESSRKTELETCARYAADRDAVRAERDSLIADGYGLTFDLEECMIAEGVPSIEYKDRIVETVVEKECPVVECPSVVECLSVDTACSEVQAKYDVCVKEKDTAVQAAREEIADDLAVCGVYKGQLQFVYDECIGEQGRLRDALGKRNIDSANAALQASRVLGETKEQLARAQKDGEQCKREYQTLEARTAGSNYERIKADPSQVMAVAEDYVRRNGGLIRVYGSNCNEALRNFSGLITGNINDANIEQIIVEKTRSICGKIDPLKGYVDIKVKK